MEVLHIGWPQLMWMLRHSEYLSSSGISWHLGETRGVLSPGELIRMHPTTAFGIAALCHRIYQVVLHGWHGDALALSPSMHLLPPLMHLLPFAKDLRLLEHLHNGSVFGKFLELALQDRYRQWQIPDSVFPQLFFMLPWGHCRVKGGPGAH